MVLLGTVVTGGALLLGGWSLLRSQAERNLELKTETLALDVASRLEEGLLMNDLYRVSQQLQELGRTDADWRYAYVLDPQGQVIAHTFGAGFPQGLLELSGVVRFSNAQREVIYQSEALLLAGQMGRLRLGLSDRSVSNQLGALLRWGLLGLVLAGALGLAASYVLVVRFMTPVQAMLVAVQRVSQGQAARSPEPPDELGRLGQSLNRMSLEVLRRTEQLSLLNKVLSEMNRHRHPETLSQAVLKMLTQELGFVCGDLVVWEHGQPKVYYRQSCQAECPLKGGVSPLAQQALQASALVWLEQGVAVPVNSQAVLALYGSPKAEKTWVEGLLLAVVAPLTAALENAKLYAAVQEKETQRMGLMEAFLQAQEQERARISRELHDEVGQALTGLILGLNTLEPGADENRVLMLKEMARMVLEDVRRLSVDLRPSVLDHLGLEAALQRYVREFQSRSGLLIDASIYLPHRLAPKLETVLYRVVQEALTNIARHARASEVSLSLIAHKGQVKLTIEDNGVGFTLQQVSKERLGLLGMRERVELAEGELSIESSLGQGTRIAVSLPIRTEVLA